MVEFGRSLVNPADDEDLPEFCCCTVCFELYNRDTHLAQSLYCGHTMCKGCLSDMKSTNIEIECPTCRTKHRYEGDLPTNFSVMHAVEQYLQTRPNVKCTDCKQKVEKRTTVCCMNCSTATEFFLACHLCFIRKHRNHDVIDYNDYEMRKVRVDTQKHLNELDAGMYKAKADVTKALGILQLMYRKLESEWKQANIPESFLADASLVQNKAEANALREASQELHDETVESCQNFLAAIEQTKEEIRKRLDAIAHSDSSDSSDAEGENEVHVIVG